MSDFLECSVNNQQINRMVAKLAAKNTWYKGLESDEDLLAEAKATDTFYCTDAEMIAMCRAEHNKCLGQALGGHVAAAKRRSDAQVGISTSPQGVQPANALSGFVKSSIERT